MSVRFFTRSFCFLGSEFCCVDGVGHGHGHGHMRLSSDSSEVFSVDFV